MEVTMNVNEGILKGLWLYPRKGFNIYCWLPRDGRGNAIAKNRGLGKQVYHNAWI